MKKKLIELNDDLVERLEALKDRFNVKSLAPIVDIVLTIGLAQFEQFASGTVIINQPVYIPDTQPYNPYPTWPTQPWYKVWCGEDTVDPDKVTWNHGDWTITCNYTTGGTNVTYKE